MQEISEANGVSPQHIYLLLKPIAEGDGSAAMPEEAPGGTGSRTLAQLCDMYKLDAPQMVLGLATQGIEARPEQTMKEIAAANGIDPHAVYATLYALANK